MLLAHPRSQATRATRSYAFFTIWPTTDGLLVFIICCEKLFFIVFSSMSRCSLQYVWYLSLSSIWWTSTCLLIYIWVVNQHLSKKKSKIHKSTHLNMRSKLERRLFACDHSTQQSSVRLHIIYLERKGGGGHWTWEQSRYFQNDFQTWTGWHKLSTHWIYIVFLLKYSAWFVPGFSFINIHISLERSNSPKSVSGHLIILLVATRMTSLKNILGRKSKNMWGKSRHWFILS